MALADTAAGATPISSAGQAHGKDRDRLHALVQARQDVVADHSAHTNRRTWLSKAAWFYLDAVLLSLDEQIKVIEKATRCLIVIDERGS